MKTDLILKNAVIDGTLKTIIINNGKIADVTKNGTEGIDLKGQEVIPGLIDVHTHGICGMDTMDADFEKMCLCYARFGTTSFLPTLMTMPTADLLRVSNAKTDFYGANILGFHFEGPYISAEKKGAQDERNILKADINHFKQFKNVKMMTLAPETEGAVDFIGQVSKDTVISIGHTACDAPTAKKAIEAGAKCLTHIYNAMPPMLHRNCGPIGEAVKSNIFAQIISDGFHVSPNVVYATYKMFGADRLVLISDSIRPAKASDGVYNCGGLEVTLKDNKALLSDGTIAGSVSTLFDCLKCAISFGIPKADAVKMATETPAKLLGVKKGKIEKGYDADLLVLDNNFEISDVIIGGEFIR